MKTPILIPLKNLITQTFLYTLVPLFLSYYLISDSLTFKNFFPFYAGSFLLSISFINKLIFYKSFTAVSFLDGLLDIILFFSVFAFIFYLGDFKQSLFFLYFILFIINYIAFIIIYNSFKDDLFSCFLKSNNLNENTKMFDKIEILIAHKLFFNKNKKQLAYFSCFKFIKILSIIIAFSSLFYYFYLFYNAHLNYILFIFIPILSFISYFIIKKFLLVIHFLITPLRLVFNIFFKNMNHDHFYCYRDNYDSNGIAVFQENNIKTIESKYKELFKPILIYDGKTSNVSDSLWNDFKNSRYDNFLSFLKGQEHLKKLEKLKKINDF